MSRSLFILLALIPLNLSSKDNFPEDRLDKEQVDMIKQQMEEMPSSTTVGGARSGQLESEKARDDQRTYEAQKQKQLFESDGYYRRGL